MNYRALLIRIATFLGGLYLFLNFVLPAAWFATPLEPYDERVKLSFTIVGSMAFALGLINIFMVHGTRIAFLRKGWFNSIALLIGFLAMGFVTYLDWRDNDRIAARSGAFSLYRDFAERITADHKAGTPGLPPVPFRLEKLVEAVESAAGTARASAAQIADQNKLEPDPIRMGLVGSGIADLTAALDNLDTEVGRLRGVLASSPEIEGSFPTVIQPVLEGVMPRLQDVSTTYRAVLLMEHRETLSARLYRLLFEGLAVPLGTAMFALLGFYIATAAYRAFRIRSAESGLMLFAALLVMLGQIPFGLWIWDGFPAVRNWLLTIPSGGARLAIEIGVSIAGLVMAFRMWLSIESESFSEKKK
jgi:hypothetical protein